MKKTTPKSDEVWYVDSGALNHMTSHEEWFSYLEKPEQPRVFKIGDDTPHPIEHVGKVSLSHIGQKGKLMNVLHCPENYEKSGIGRIDRRPGDASSIHASRVNRGRGLNYCARAQRWEDVHP